MKKVAIYARVSTDKQTTENQLRELRNIVDKNGWELVNEFVDEGISGAKGRDKRPQFDALMKSAVRREIDVVMAWSMVLPIWKLVMIQLIQPVALTVPSVVMVLWIQLMVSSVILVIH